jgi:hypothetical protein
MQPQAVLPLSAVQQIRRMRGGSQSQFMRASDGNYYITKFQGNPQTWPISRFANAGRSSALRFRLADREHAGTPL